MAEKEEVFSSTIKYQGIFSFKELYKFCYEWLTQEADLELMEKKYSEKIAGDSKEVKIEWSGKKKITDYFQFEAGVKFVIRGLTQVELEQKGVKTRTNSGEIKISMTGTLHKDYQGKFETSAYKKFLRGIYQKWIIPSSIEEYTGNIVKECDEFLDQTKSFLDLEGKR